MNSFFLSPYIRHVTYLYIPPIACFLESLQNSLCRAGKGDAAHDVKVHTSVYTGHYTDSPELGLKVHITIEGVEDDDAIIEAQKVSSLTFLSHWP